MNVKTTQLKTSLIFTRLAITIFLEYKINSFNKQSKQIIFRTNSVLERVNLYNLQDDFIERPIQLQVSILRVACFKQYWSCQL